MIRSYLENDRNLKSQSDDTLSSLKDSYTINLTFRDPQQNSSETAALPIQQAQTELLFHEKDEGIFREISLFNDDDSLPSTTTVDETDDWEDEYDDDESQSSTRAVSEGGKEQCNR